jgi:prepilin-type N-terminal cleavage/methylation domain-containing protein
MVSVRKRDAGFTLTELMVVVVIILLLAAVSTPLFSRDNSARKGRDWAKIVAQILQRARFQAMGDRANIHVVLSRTQVDMFREDSPSTYTLLSSTVGPVAAGNQTVAIWDAKVNDLVSLPGAQVLPTEGTTALTSPGTNDIVFTSLGSATTAADKTTPATWRVYLRNELLPSIHPDASFVITVTGLTGFISSNDKVTLP